MSGKWWEGRQQKSWRIWKENKERGKAGKGAILIPSAGEAAGKEAKKITGAFGGDLTVLENGRFFH